MKTSEPFGGYFTVPKLLERNAREFSNSPAYREKEYGIWQTWNWKQSEEEITALANGLISMGLKVGDKVAIIGRNRPALYWSFIAAQMVGAIPVPIYNDAVGDEIHMYWSTAGLILRLLVTKSNVINYTILKKSYQSSLR